MTSKTIAASKKSWFRVGILVVFLPIGLAGFLPSLPKILQNWSAWQEERSYQKLVKEIRKLRGQAMARGVDLFGRQDFFTCKACGTYEDVFYGSEKKVTLLASKEITEREFTVLRHREHCSGLESGGTKCTTVYRLRCGVCGLEQRALFSAEFDF